MDANAEIPARVDAVEKNVVFIDEDLDAFYREFDKLAATVIAHASAEANTRAEAIAMVRQELVEASVGNYPTLVFGAVWLAVGIVISTFAHEIARIVVGN